MTNLTEKMLEKAKNAKSAEELLAIAKENNIEMTEEEAESCFAKLNSKSSELSDDMLGNVAGGVETLRRGDSPSSKPSNNGTNELLDDELDNVAGGNCSLEVPALAQCPTCGALYPMGEGCPKCTAVAEYESEK